MCPVPAGTSTASGFSAIPGARSSTSKTRSNETIALITSTRTLDSCGQRAVQPGEQQCQRDDRAGRDAAPTGDREPAAEPVRQRLRQRRDEQHRHEERTAEHGLLDADVPDPVGALGKSCRLVVRSAEQLDQQRAGDAEPLGHRGVHLRVELVRLAGDGGESAAHPAGRQDEQRQHRERQHGDLPRQREHHGRRSGRAG